MESTLRAIAEAIERESVLIHRDALIDGYREIMKLSKLGADMIVRKAAEYGGKKGAITLKERYGVYTDIFEDAMKFLSVIAESSRMIDLFEYNISSMEIHIEGSILVEAVGSSDKPVCKPMASFFKGFLTELLGKEVNVQEVSCQAQGKEKCVFKIELK